MNDKSKRKPDIDVLKGIGIVLVMLGHQNLPIGHFIYSFHMPLFFLILFPMSKNHDILNAKEFLNFQ